jgi:hypothetical protein
MSDPLLWAKYTPFEFLRFYTWKLDFMSEVEGYSEGFWVALLVIVPIKRLDVKIRIKSCYMGRKLYWVDWLPVGC